MNVSPRRKYFLFYSSGWRSSFERYFTTTVYIVLWFSWLCEWCRHWTDV